MNKLVHGKRWVVAVLVTLVVSMGPMAPTIARAATGWQVGVGAENQDMAIQAAYFFSREVTVNVGDSVTWNFQTGEPHSVNFFAGTGSGGPIDSGLQVKGAPPFSLTFNLAGDYNYGCDIHPTMSGVVHVQAAGSTYPHDQNYYDHQSQVQQNQLLAEGRALRAQGLAAAAQAGSGQITAGIGATHETGAIYVMRFQKEMLNVKVGDTVTFSNLDPEAPHTVTFNLDYPNPFGAAFPFGLDDPGPPGHATMSTTTQQVNSGFLWAFVPIPGIPVVGTVFKVKFTQPGTYNYKCELHDDLGMTGAIKVTPRG